MGAGLSLFSRPLCQIVGNLYPAYASFKALKSPNAEDDKQWLTYWVVHSLFSVAEYWGDYLLFWTPFYYELKILFLLYLQLPQTRGALHLYEKFIGPWLEEHEEVIDARLDEAKGQATETVKSVSRSAFQRASGFVTGPMLAWAMTQFAALQGAAAAKPKTQEKEEEKKKSK